MTILVSACLLGLETRYDGRGKAVPALRELAKQHTLVPVCPEQLGGLPTPRTPCEIQNGSVISREGEDKTEAFESGARQAQEIYHLSRCEAAILKSRSPSCGKDLVYDGSFSGVLVKGSGIFANLLQKNGIPIFSEEEIDHFYAWLKQRE